MLVAAKNRADRIVRGMMFAALCISPLGAVAQSTAPNKPNSPTTTPTPAPAPADEPSEETPAKDAAPKGEEPKKTDPKKAEPEKKPESKPKESKDKQDDTKSKTDAKSEDVLTVGKRWRGIAENGKQYTISVKERSEKEKTATLRVDPEGKGHFTLDVRVDGKNYKVTRATRSMNGFTDADDRCTFTVAVEKDGSLRIGGEGHFDRARAGVRNAAFKLEMVAKPLEAEEEKAGKNKKKRGK